MLYERQHLAILKSRMTEPRRRIQIIMGPRQVGKSTLVGQYTDGLDIPFDFIAADGVNREDTNWISARWQDARMKMDMHGENERILIIDEVQKIRPILPREPIGRSDVPFRSSPGRKINASTRRKHSSVKIKKLAK